MGWTVIYDGTDITDRVVLQKVRGATSGRTITTSVEVVLNTRGAAVSFTKGKILSLLQDGTPRAAGWVTGITLGYIDGTVPVDDAETWTLILSDIYWRLKKTMFAPNAAGLVMAATETLYTRLVRVVGWINADLVAHGLPALIDTDFSHVLGATFLFDAKAYYPLPFAGQFHYDAISALCAYGGADWHLKPIAGGKWRLYTSNAFSPSIGPVEFADTDDVSSVTPVVGGKTILGVAVLDLTSDIVATVNKLWVSWNDGKSTKAIINSGSIADWTALEDRMAVLDTVTEAMATSLANHQIAHNVSEVWTGKLRVPYRADIQPAMLYDVHATRHYHGITPGTTARTYVRGVTMNFADTAELEPVSLDLDLSPDIFEPPKLKAISPSPPATGIVLPPTVTPPTVCPIGQHMEKGICVPDDTPPGQHDPWDNGKPLWIVPCSVVEYVHVALQSNDAYVLHLPSVHTKDASWPFGYGLTSIYPDTYLLLFDNDALGAPHSDTFMIPATVRWLDQTHAYHDREWYNLGGGSKRRLIAFDTGWPTGTYTILRAALKIGVNTSHDTAASAITKIGIFPNPYKDQLPPDSEEYAWRDLGATDKFDQPSALAIALAGSSHTRVEADIPVETLDNGHVGGGAWYGVAAVANPAATNAVAQATMNLNQFLGGSWNNPQRDIRAGHVLTLDIPDLRNLTIGGHPLITAPLLFDAAHPIAQLGFDPRTPPEGVLHPSYVLLMTNNSDPAPWGLPVSRQWDEWNNGDNYVLVPAYRPGSLNVFLNDRPLVIGQDVLEIYTPEERAANIPPILLDFSPVRPIAQGGLHKTALSPQLAAIVGESNDIIWLVYEAWTG